MVTGRFVTVRMRRTPTRHSDKAILNDVELTSAARCLILKGGNRTNEIYLHINMPGTGAHIHGVGAGQTFGWQRDRNSTPRNCARLVSDCARGNDRSSRGPTDDDDTAEHFRCAVSAAYLHCNTACEC